MKLILPFVIALVSFVSASPVWRSRQERHHSLASRDTEAAAASRLDRIQQMYAFEGFVYALDVGHPSFFLPALISKYHPFRTARRIAR